MSIDPILMARLAACAFFAAVFIQSSLDKVLDRKGNIEWMTPYFAKSPFRNAVGFLLSLLTLVELLSGIGSAAGFVTLLLSGPLWIPQAAMACVCFNFVFLILGQRLSKDYAGAAATAGYFAGALLGLMSMVSGNIVVGVLGQVR